MNKLLARLLIHMPRPLPVGMKEFDVFANRILSITGLYADEDSMRFALSTNIIHADASLGKLSDKHFVNRLRKAAANQVASQVFQDVKAKQTERAAAEALAAQQKQAEATAQDTVASDVKEV